LYLEPPHAAAEHAEAVDHGGVRIGTDERVGERLAVTRLDDAAEVLEVHLMADSRVGRDNGEVIECLLSPAQECVALTIAFELELSVALEREPRRELVDLDGVG